MNMIAVIDCRNRTNNVPEWIDCYPDTLWGRTQSRQRFCELVGMVLQEAENLSENDALKQAAEFLNVDDSIYEVGEGYIALLENGVTFHEPPRVSRVLGHIAHAKSHDPGGL